jgi:cyclase
MTDAMSAGSARSQRDVSAVEIKTTKLAPGVYMLAGAGGNIGVSAGEDGVFLIDDQFAPLGDKIRAAIRAISDTPIRFVLNTHWHGDHTGGNERFGKEGVVIIAQDQVRVRLATDQVRASGEKAPASPRAALPIVTFTDSVTFHMNDDTVIAFHVPPAHTDGDVIVRFENANVVHMGDCFFNGLYPVIDTPAAGNLDGMIHAVDLALPRIDAKTRVIPGHGPLGDRASLIAFRDMMVHARDAIRPLVAAGKSPDEIVAAHPTTALDGQWGGGTVTPERFVRSVVAGMAKKHP